MLLRLRGATVPGRLAPFSADLPNGQLLHLVGPNGAGKSSMLALLAGMLEGMGETELLGTPLADWHGPALARIRAWLPQQQVQPGIMPVYHYLRLHLQNSQNDERVIELLERLQLRDKLQRPLTQLSGGEWQRVRLAAVCAQIDPGVNPQGKLLILDEPMTALDIAQQHAVDGILTELCCQGVGIIASSHDLNHTLTHADEVWLMQKGTVVAQGEPHAVLSAGQLSAVYQIPFRQFELDGRTLLTAQP